MGFPLRNAVIPGAVCMRSGDDIFSVRRPDLHTKIMEKRLGESKKEKYEREESSGIQGKNRRETMEKEGLQKNEGCVIAVCTSEKKGTQKKPVDEIKLVQDWGIEGDAHAGKWHRQVSLLSLERIEEFRTRGAQVEYGAFGENIVISGFDFKSEPVGTRFRIGDVLLEMTQIGKECHSHCEIYKVMGDCIMPREGVFTRVLHGGIVRPGDTVKRVAE